MQTKIKTMKKLTRAALKSIQGGVDCTLSIQGADGSWISRPGTCKKRFILNPIGSGDTAVYESYCDAGLGAVPVTSNGGKSRCP